MVTEYGVICSYACSGQCPSVIIIHTVNISSGNKCGEPRHEFWEYKFIKKYFYFKISHCESFGNSGIDNMLGSPL